MLNQILKSLKMTFFATIFGFFSIGEAVVWQDTQTWSANAEQSYSQWVKLNWSKNFFNQKTFSDGKINPFYGLRVDCADTVYTMRIAYSYIHQLPFAINDPTGGKKLITNRMSRFDKLTDENQRIKKFMHFIYDIVSTRSIPNDTFPVALSSKWVKSGALILTTKLNHHSWTIKDILDIGVPWLVFNSRAGAASGIVIQERKTWPNPSWIFEGDNSINGNAGFRYWKPIDKLELPAWEQDGYSEEQYSIPLKLWQQTAQNSLKLIDEKPEESLKRLMETSCEELKARVGAVKDGYLYLSKNSDTCMDFETYDNYSTPSRDQRFYDSLIELRNKYSLYRDKQFSNEIKNQLQKIYPDIEKSLKEEASLMNKKLEVTMDSYCVVNYSASENESRIIDLAEAKRRLFNGYMSNNPHDPFEFRWGEQNKKVQSSLAKKCQSWDPWEPKLNE